MTGSLLTVGEIASRYKVHRQTVYTWLKQGVCEVRLKSVRVGGSLRIREEDLIVFCREIERKKGKGK